MPAHLFFFSLNFITVAGHLGRSACGQPRTRAAGNSCTLEGRGRGLPPPPRISRSVARANKFLELGSTRSKSERKPPVHAAPRFLHATSTRFNWPSTRLERSLLSFPPFCPFSFFPLAREYIYIYIYRRAGIPVATKLTSYDDARYAR